MGLVGLTRPILWNSSRHVMPSASTLSAFNEKLKTSPFLNVCMLSSPPLAMRFLAYQSATAVVYIRLGLCIDYCLFLLCRDRRLYACESSDAPETKVRIFYDG